MQWQGEKGRAPFFSFVLSSFCLLWNAEDNNRRRDRSARIHGNNNKNVIRGMVLAERTRRPPLNGERNRKNNSNNHQPATRYVVRCIWEEMEGEKSVCAIEASKPKKD
jgi:hypothetical protein